MKYKFNLMAIIAGLIFFAIGLFLALMDAFVWGSPTAIAFFYAVFVIRVFTIR